MKSRALRQSGRFLVVLAVAALASFGCDDDGNDPEDMVADAADTTTGGDSTAPDVTDDDTGTTPDATEPDATGPDATDPDVTTGDTTDVTDGGMDMVDMNMPDTEPPTVTATDPVDEALDLPTTVRLRITFSEPMDTSVGSLTATVDGNDFATLDAGAGQWEAGDTELVWVLEELPAGASVEVAIATTFADIAGNGLPEASTVTFTTSALPVPTVTGSSPAEGASDVTAATQSIVVGFSTAMDTSAGTLTLTGAGASLGTLAWTNDRSLAVPVDGLVSGETYSLALAGFVSADGVALDGMPYLTDGALDFSTVLDDPAPTVVLASPTEGQTDVSSESLDDIRVIFSEPMDETIVTAPLTESGGTSTNVTATWTDSRTAVFDLTTTTLAFSATYGLDLTGFADAGGTALDGTPVLTDGVLDFTTGADETDPTVLSTDPIEGATDVSVYDVTEVQIVFSEFMDITTTMIPYTSGMATGTATGTWSMGGNTLTVDVTGLLTPAAAFSLDLASLTDANGNALDGTPVVLDGAIDFTVAAPTGEGCLDPLTTAAATQDPMTGAWTWSFVDDQFVTADVGTCDSSPAAEGLIVYEKTSDTIANGGELLIVSASSADDVMLQVTQDACSPDVGGTELYCVGTGAADPAQAFDVPPGTYYIAVGPWLSSDDFFAVDVTVNEGPPPAGETCDSAIGQVAAVDNGDGSYTWTLPGQSVYSDDQDFSCDTTKGNDVVVEFIKSQPDSTLSIDVSSLDSSNGNLTVAVFDGCDPATASETSCSTSSDTHSISAAAPAGSVFIAVSQTSSVDSFPGATVTVSEEFGSAGTSCPAAFAASGPTIAVAGASTEANTPPSCFPSTSNIEWYSVTATQDLVSVLANTDGAIALVNSSNLTELSCSTAGSTQPASYFIGNGNSVCVAVEVGQGITSLQVDELPYPGLDDSNGTNLYIDRPGTGAGSPESWTSESWMVVDQTNIYMGVDVFSDWVAVAPRVGGTMAAPVEAVEVPTGVDSHTGLLVNGDIFAADDTSTTDAARLYRIYDSSTSMFLAEAWDPMPSFLNDPIYSLAYDGARIWAVTDDSASSLADTLFYSWSPTDSVAGATLEMANDHAESVTGFTMDATYFYYAGEVDGVEGIYRLDRSAPRTTVPTPLVEVNIDSTSGPSALFLDNPANPSVLYFRSQDEGGIYAVVEPDSPSPIYAGQVIDTGATFDDAFFYDPVEDAIYLFTTENVSTGEIWRYGR